VTSTEDFLGQGGIPSAKFDAIGDTYEGIIMRDELRDQTDIETGVAQTWDDGTPKKMILLDVQTQLNDPDIDADDGMRRFYIKSAFLTALRTEWRRIGGVPLVGCHIKATYHADGEKKQRGKNAAKLFKVALTPPAGQSSVSPDDLT
jgi:hypothetical protein